MLTPLSNESSQKNTEIPVNVPSDPQDDGRTKPRSETGKTDSNAQGGPQPHFADEQQPEGNKAAEIEPNVQPHNTSERLGESESDQRDEIDSQSYGGPESKADRSLSRQESNISEGSGVLRASLRSFLEGLKTSYRSPTGNSNWADRQSRLLLEKVPWFFVRNVATSEDLSQRALAIHTYETTGFREVALEEEQTICRYKIHVDLFHSLKTMFDASLRNRSHPHSDDEFSDTRLLIRCPVDHGTYFLDAAVELLAKDIHADLIRIDTQDLLDLAQYVDDADNGLQDLCLALNYSCHSDEGPSREDHSYQVENQKQSDALEKDLSTILYSIINSAVAKASCMQLDGIAMSTETASKPAALILHVRDFKEMMSHGFGRSIVAGFGRLIREKRQRGEPAVLIGSFCSSSILTDLQSDQALQKATTSRGPERVVDLTPPGSGRQRAILANDHPRWNLETNVRRLQYALRHIGAQIPEEGDLLHPLTSWDTVELAESLRTDLETSMWSQGRVLMTATYVRHGNTERLLKIEHLAKAIQVIKSCFELNSEFAGRGPSQAAARWEDRPELDNSQQDIHSRVASVLGNSSNEIARELARGIVEPGEANDKY
jgi:hypothetical protein